MTNSNEGPPVGENESNDGFDPVSYWKDRYARGGTSGAGSYGRLALFKAEFLNQFVARRRVTSVIEFGCGDGNQLSLAEYPMYLGLDPSVTAIRACAARFAADASKSFYVYETAAFFDTARLFVADLAISLDVVYHLTDDALFTGYMRHLFSSARRFVIVYASDREEITADRHVRHRRFTNWATANAPNWTLAERLPNRYPYDPALPNDTSFADFHVFESMDDH